MFILTLGLALTGVLVAAARLHAGWHAQDFGVMSHQWLANYNASRPASSL
jgi:hypothetical protein